MEIGDLPLSNGEVLRACRLVWVEHGVRNAAGNNTVVCCCAIGSTHHRLDFLIGPGRALDTRFLHVVVIDALGNGLSCSPSNSAAQPDAQFPYITIADMVESQRRLLDRLGIAQHVVLGASMGAMQALQWAASYPRRVRALVAMTAGARVSRWAQLLNEISRRMLFEDEALTRPRDRNAAMALWAPFTQMVVPSSPQAADDFRSVDDLRHAVASVQARFTCHGPTAFDWRCQTRAYDAHDIADEAVRAIECPTLVLAPPLDLYNPVEGARDIASMIPNARYVEIPSDRGHRAANDALAQDVDFVNAAIREFLKGVSSSEALG